MGVRSKLVKGGDLIWEFFPPQFWEIFPRFSGCSTSSSSSSSSNNNNNHSSSSSRTRLLEIGNKALKNTHFFAPRGAPLKTAIKL